MLSLRQQLYITTLKLQFFATQPFLLVSISYSILYLLSVYCQYI